MCIDAISNENESFDLFEPIEHASTKVCWNGRQVEEWHVDQCQSLIQALQANHKTQASSMLRKMPNMSGGNLSASAGYDKDGPYAEVNLTIDFGPSKSDNSGGSSSNASNDENQTETVDSENKDS